MLKDVLLFDKDKWDIKDILAQTFFSSQYSCGEARKKIGAKCEQNVNFFTTGPSWKGTRLPGNF